MPASDMPDGGVGTAVDRVQASGNRASPPKAPAVPGWPLSSWRPVVLCQGDIRNLITAWTLKLPARETCKAQNRVICAAATPL